MGSGRGFSFSSEVEVPVEGCTIRLAIFRNGLGSARSRVLPSALAGPGEREPDLPVRFSWLDECECSLELLLPMSSVPEDASNGATLSAVA